MACFKLASSFDSKPQSVLDQVRYRYGSSLDSDTASWTDSAELRAALGKAAHKKNWFKSVTKGKQWADTVAAHISDLGIETDLSAQLLKLRDWVHCDAG